MPKSPKVWIDTDIGNDIDDVLALMVCINEFGKDRICGVSTTFYKPDQKARIAKVILEAMNCRTIPVHAGIGIYNPQVEGRKMLESKYQCWPSIFPVPWDPTSLSQQESLAYREFFPNFENVMINKDTNNEGMNRAITKNTNDLILLSIGFHTNLAASWNLIRHKKVNRIVIMGGWYEDGKGEVIRLGYNSGVDLKSTKILFEQKEIPVLIVNSEFCKSFWINNSEYEQMQQIASKPNSSALAKAVCKDMKIWMEGKKQEHAKEKIYISDPVTAYLAAHPEEIEITHPVELQVSSPKPNIDQRHPDAKNYLHIKRVASSNVEVVRSVKNPEKIRKAIVDTIISIISA